MDRVFLDANVLFSAAYRPDAGLRRLWKLPDTRLVSSVYAAEEARRNLNAPGQRKALEELLDDVELTYAAYTESARVPAVELPDKDWPILLAAVSAGATHLLTGDPRHFGPYYGEKPGGILILTPGDYLASS